MGFVRKLEAEALLVERRTKLCAFLALACSPYSVVGILTVPLKGPIAIAKHDVNNRRSNRSCEGHILPAVPIEISYGQ